MKKIVFTILKVVALIIAVDLLCIFIFNRPVFAIEKEMNSLDYTYEGLIYNTYKCSGYPKAVIKLKTQEFSCEDSREYVYGEITGIKKDYLIVKGYEEEGYLKKDLEAHIDLSNNPIITGTNNLIIGQKIKADIIEAKELYPVLLIVNQISIVREFEIIDKTLEMKDFMCAEALEMFYEDEKYQYYYSCIKDQYIVIKYKNGDEIKVSEALKNNLVTIDEVMNNIKVYKEKKK